VLSLPEEKWKGEGAVRGFRGRKDATRMFVAVSVDRYSSTKRSRWTSTLRRNDEEQKFVTT
jgi:hypothetical protein